MKIELAKTEIIHFIGIGGIGMSGLALIMKGMGFKIQGSDIKEVKTDQNTNIEGEKHERVGKNRTEYIQGNHRENIQGLFVATTVDDWENIVKGKGGKAVKQKVKVGG